MHQLDRKCFRRRWHYVWMSGRKIVGGPNKQNKTKLHLESTVIIGTSVTISNNNNKSTATMTEDSILTRNFRTELWLALKRIEAYRFYKSIKLGYADRPLFVTDRKQQCGQQTSTHVLKQHFILYFPVSLQVIRRTAIMCACNSSIPFNTIIFMVHATRTCMSRCYFTGVYLFNFRPVVFLQYITEPSSTEESWHLDYKPPYSASRGCFGPGPLFVKTEKWKKNKQKS